MTDHYFELSLHALYCTILQEEETELLEGDEDDKLVVYTGDKCGEELLAEYYTPMASASMTDMKVLN